ncbi:hypothetical protein S40285_09969 [Stachybotrys chlorohalonatus IBT 40285]|uniref:Secreted protein n=1 Tax=Stachybotrys chlorohalonatus (strain IBT 40285) TaxID=1283841 RepID=A0A084QG29_STAC4|nr:hypothetical protein S40285_09969 [Stachybotrys chlorohalonata IBT 40285]
MALSTPAFTLSSVSILCAAANTPSLVCYVIGNLHAGTVGDNAAFASIESQTLHSQPPGRLSRIALHDPFWPRQDGVTVDRETCCWGSFTAHCRRAVAAFSESGGVLSRMWVRRMMRVLVLRKTGPWRRALELRQKRRTIQANQDG